MSKLCECGCGQRVSLASATNKKRGNIKGQPVRFVRGHTNWVRGKDHGKWKGGRKKGPKNYIMW